MTKRGGGAATAAAASSAPPRLVFAAAAALLASLATTRAAGATSATSIGPWGRLPSAFLASTGGRTRPAAAPTMMRGNVFVPEAPPPPPTTTRSVGSSSTALAMAGKKSKKKGGGGKKRGGGGGGSSGGIKGFGSSPSAVASPSSSSSSSSSSALGGDIDRSRPSMDFYSYLERNGAGSNLKRVALAHFPVTEDGSVKIRGVVALRKIKKGEAIIDVPYELAMNLGRESSDPTLPAVTLLREYCSQYASPEAEGGERAAYLAMLPEFMGADCLGSTDFFPDEALDALQSPPVRDETLKRRDRTRARYEEESSGVLLPLKWSDGGPIAESHLRWAVWLVTSRVLTVRGAEGTSDAFRLMIPLVDMCNHDRSSPHVLAGRAVPGGRLRVLAGRTVEAGEQIHICYGGGAAGNDRFVQDYGFLDTFDDGTAFDIVAKALAGRTKARDMGGGGNLGLMREGDRQRALEALRETTAEDDEALLGTDLEGPVRSAVEYRLGVKRALERIGEGDLLKAS